MIHVIATICVKPGGVPQFLKIFKDNVPAVKAEAGCIEYGPTTDVATGLAAQSLDAHAVVVIEKWSNIEALRNHLAAPHMLAYREKVKGLVSSTSIKVLQDA